MKLLHIYTQSFWHESAAIVGNREALEALADTLRRVLESEPPAEGRIEAETADGEGYECRVIRIEDERTWSVLALPYTDEVAQTGNVGKVKP